MPNRSPWRPWLPPLLLAGILGVVILGACATRPPWRRLPLAPAPWCAPGRIAIPARRLPPPAEADRQLAELRWEDPAGPRFARNDIERQINDYWHAHPALYESWPQALKVQIKHDRYGAIVPRLSPYRWYLVSLAPTILLALPKDDRQPDPEPASANDPGCLFSLFFVNPIMIDTQLPPVRELWWCSPTLKTAPSRLDLSGGQASIRLAPGDCLQLVRQGGALRVVRQQQ